MEVILPSNESLFLYLPFASSGNSSGNLLLIIIVVYFCHVTFRTEEYSMKLEA